MSIVSRGPKNILVIERNSVPVKDICDAVAEHKTLSWLKQRYNVNPDEVFDCLDTYVDMSERGNKNVLSLAVFRDDNQRIAGIETVAINDRVYFAILSYGRMFFPAVENFNELFARTLNVVIIECLMDIVDGLVTNDESRFFIHNVVLRALEKATSLQFDQNNVQSVLEDLDYKGVLKEIGK